MTDTSDSSEKGLDELTIMELIRKRPTMYIGSMSRKGFADLTRGIFITVLEDTAAKRISITLTDARSGKLQIHHEPKSFSNHWSKWSGTSFHYRYELLVLNALSERFAITFWDTPEEGKTTLTYQKGELVNGKELEAVTCSGFDVEFTLDEERWESDFSIDALHLMSRLKEFAYLHSKVRFDYQYAYLGENCRVIFAFENGLKDRLKEERMKGLGPCYFELHIAEQIEDFYLETAFAFRELDVDEAYLISYANDAYTSEHGSHVDGLLKGVTNGVMKYFKKHKLTQDYKISEKGMKAHLIATINVRLTEPEFSGCVKNKLANPEIIRPIANRVAEALFTQIEADPRSTQKLIQKFKV